MRMKMKRSRPWGFKRFKKPVNWIRDVFDEGTIDNSATGLVEALSLAEYDDVEPTTTIVQNKYTVKRIVISGAIVPAILAGSASGNISTMIRYALVKLDAEDTDADLTAAGQGSLLQAHRILQTGTWGFGVRTTTTFSSAQDHFALGQRIDIDWKGNTLCGPDDAVFLLMQRVFPIPGIDLSARYILDYSLSSNVLISMKGA